MTELFESEELRIEHMNGWSGNSASAKAILEKVDKALVVLAKDDLRAFQDEDKKRREEKREIGLPSPKSFGLEAPFFHDRLFAQLRNEFGDIVIHKPRLPGKRHNDLGIIAPDCPTYIELGNYYAGAYGKYSNDLKKLEERLQIEPQAMGVIIHLHHNPDESDLQPIFEKLLLELGEEPHWKNLPCKIADGGSRHFLRLAFRRK